MSKVIDQLHAVLLNERRVSISPLVLFEKEYITNGTFAEDYKLRIKATFGKEIWVKHDLGGITDNYVQTALTNIKRSVAEELFGEFRKPLLDAMMLVHEEKAEEAIQKIQGILYDMFKP